MKYVDEFRDPKKAKFLINDINLLVEQIDICKQRPLQIMEVCGGHTHTIFRYGIEQMSIWCIRSWQIIVVIWGSTTYEVCR